MNIAGLFFLIITQFLCGLALLSLFKIEGKTIVRIAVANIFGVLIFSFIPFILELFHIPIVGTNLAIFIAAFTLLSLVQIIKAKEFSKFVFSFKVPPIYEFPFLIVFGLLIFLSVWRCYFYAPNARDMLSGPEVIAEFAVREHKMINSIFTVDLSTTNNQYKPPYIISLQILYKIFVQPFGQVWLSVIFISYTILIFTFLREKLHPIIYYTVLLYYFAMPELFGYTYLMLFDYSNMVLLFLGYYYLNSFLVNKRKNELFFSVVLFAFANYIRVETIIMMGFFVPRIMYVLYKDKVSLAKIAWQSGIIMVGAAAIYVLVMNVFLKNYIPGAYNVGHDVNPHIWELSGLFKRLSDIVTVLIFGPDGFNYFGVFIKIFLFIVVMDTIIFRKFNREQLNYLYGVVAIYLGLGVMGHLLPLADLTHTTKRGMFKLFPLMIMYISNSNCLVWLSDQIKDWEFPPIPSAYTPRQPVAAAQVKPKPSPTPKNKR
jgi:hypothetical protein